MEKLKKIKQIAVRFDNETYEKIERCSQAEHRDVSALIRHIVMEYVEKARKK